MLKYVVISGLRVIGSVTITLLVSNIEIPEGNELRPQLQITNLSAVSSVYH